jgi:hypothetical protein
MEESKFRAVKVMTPCTDSCEDVSLPVAAAVEERDFPDIASASNMFCTKNMKERRKNGEDNFIIFLNL